MPKVFYRGGSDTHLVNGDDETKRNILFTRCDDAPLPYAEVTDAEAATLLADPSGLYAAQEGAPDAPAGVTDTPATPAAPVRRPGRKPKVEG